MYCVHAFEAFETPLTLIDLLKLMASLTEPGFENRLIFNPIKADIDKELFPSVIKGKLISCFLILF
jgi:hypothetical protein